MEANTNITNGEVYDWYILVGKGLSVNETFKVFKEKFELPGYQQSDTRLFSKLQTLEKNIKSIKRKKMTLVPVLNISRKDLLLLRKAMHFVQPMLLYQRRNFI